MFSPCRLFLLSAKVPTRVSSVYLCSFLCTLSFCRHMTFKFDSFVDRLPFSLPRSNGHRVEESESAMFDRWRTILQFYYKQRRWGYHRGRRYDRGLTHGDSKYLSYSTVKVCSSFCNQRTLLFARLC